MRITATLIMNADIDPLEVVKKLKDREIDFRSWVVEREGTYYQGEEVSMGSHSTDLEEVISKERYDYIKALECVIKNLESKQ